MSAAITNSHNLPYYSKTDTLTMDYVETKIKQREEILKYLPNSFKIKSLSRNFVFSLIHTIDKPLYKELEELAKTEKRKRKNKKIEGEEIIVPEEAYNEIINIPALEVNNYIINIGV